jgi:hypothetical protein
MAIPLFTPFLDAQTAYKAALGQDFFRQMQDDFDNLNGRTTRLESSVLLYDHFADQDGRWLEENNDANTLRHFELDKKGLWAVHRIHPGSNTPGDYPPMPSVQAHSSVLLDSNGNGSNNAIILAGLQEVVFNSTVRPVVFEARVQWISLGAGQPNHRFGLWSNIPATPWNTHADSGIWLSFPDGSNVRFETRDNAGTLNTGTSFTRPAGSTWFTIRIEFTDDPSNRALCYLDGVLKETFTSSLPTSRRLFPVLASIESTSSNQVYVDRCEFGAESLVDAA